MGAGGGGGGGEDPHHRRGPALQLPPGGVGLRVRGCPGLWVRSGRSPGAPVCAMPLNLLPSERLRACCRRGGGEGEQHTPAVARRGLPGRSGSLPLPPPRPARGGPAPPRGLPGAARCPLGTGHHGGPCPLGLCPPAPAPAASACPAARRARHPLSPPPAGSAGPGSGPGPAAGAGKARDGRGAAGGPGAARCWPVSCRCRGRPGRRAAASPSCRP